MKCNKTLISIFFFLSLYSCKTDERKAIFPSPEKAGRMIITDLLSRTEYMYYNTPGVSAIHYAEACTAYGAVKLAALWDDDDLLAAIADRYERVITDSITNTANHVDANVYGILPLEFYLHTNDKKYLAQGLELADGQWKETNPEGLTYQTRFWIDDVYMIGTLQTQAFRATGQEKYLDRAALELATYIDSLQRPNGLFFHGPEAAHFWGRGNGWVAAGLSEVLSELPQDHPHYPSLLDGYLNMMNTLIQYQDTSGMWHQLIDHTETFAETSSTAMFAFAMVVGVKKGLLPSDPFTKAYTKAWKALNSYLGSDGKLSEICVGTGQSMDVGYYMDRPRITGDLHGQAPMLWLVYALMKENL